MSKLTPLQIAIYAVNAPATEEYIDEVAGMIQSITSSRDFYLKVREYFQERSKILYCKDDGDVLVNCYVRKNQLEKEILKELEEFTKRDVEELPFKD